MGLFLKMEYTPTTVTRVPGTIRPVRYLINEERKDKNNNFPNSCRINLMQEKMELTYRHARAYVWEVHQLEPYQELLAV